MRVLGTRSAILLRRAAARLFDSFVIACLLVAWIVVMIPFIAMAVLYGYGAGVLWPGYVVFPLFFVGCFVLTFVYEYLCTRNSRSAGKAIFRLRVVQGSEGLHGPSRKRSLVRSLPWTLGTPTIALAALSEEPARSFCAIVAGVPAAMAVTAALGPSQRTIYDLFSGTRVVARSVAGLAPEAARTQQEPREAG